MSCLLAITVAACIFDPANLSIEAEASRQTSGDFTYRVEGIEYPNATVGRLAIQMDAPLGAGVTLRYGWEHLSLIDTDRDRGQERLFLGLVWRPFK